jgi:hypothetical protein
MSKFDYGDQAELYPSRSRSTRRQPVGYKRFDQAAEALRFAIEQMPPESLVGAYLEVGEDRFDAGEMRALYDAPDYPLPRNPPPESQRPFRTSTPGKPSADASGKGRRKPA